VFKPRAARLSGSVYAVVIASDFLRHAYDSVKGKKK